MRFIYVSIIVFLAVTGCKIDEKANADRSINSTSETSAEINKVIPEVTVVESLIDYDNSTSQWYLHDTLFNGYIVSYYENGNQKSKNAVYKGRRQNQSLKWYIDGRLKEEANYHKGKLHGEKRLWSIESDHVLVSHLNYEMGKVHGQQKQWYKTGEVYKILNFVMGKEEGIQQAYRKNGDLYANYEAKEGRIFGLKKSALCYGLEDENVKYDY